jgi:hypothetical protein
MLPFAWWCSDTQKAIALLESHGTLVLDSEVLMIENDNRPGSLSAWRGFSRRLR